jgi:uncharacterized membrane protein YkvA (DUF1232 family)
MAMSSFKARLATWARELKAELVAISRAARDPRTPWIARVLALLVVAYAASPIDLIPDFIPVLGLIDDLILLPLGVALILQLIPRDVMTEHRARAVEEAHVPPSNAGLAIVVGLWVLGLVALATLMRRYVRGPV